MLIQVEHASIEFGQRLVFDDVSAEFPSGTVTALVGPSGSGKSSLLAAMAGIQALKSGRIQLRSIDGDEASPSPELVAWVPQGSNALGTRSVLDNVAIGALSRGDGLSAAHETAHWALSLVGLSGFAEQLARSLSGGELQRVAIARAVASGKPIIFADEPSANLDAENTAVVAGVLADLSATATIVVATHDPMLVAAAQHTVNLRRN